MSIDPSTTSAPASVDRAASDEPSAGDLWAGLMVGVGTVLGFSAILYKPLLLGTVAVFLVVLGSLGNGEPSRIARAGMVVACVGFTVGMLAAIFLTNKPVW